MRNKQEMAQSSLHPGLQVSSFTSSFPWRPLSEPTSAFQAFLMIRTNLISVKMAHFQVFSPVQSQSKFESLIQVKLCAGPVAVQGGSVAGPVVARAWHGLFLVFSLPYSPSVLAVIGLGQERWNIKGREQKTFLLFHGTSSVIILMWQCSKRWLFQGPYFVD